MPDQDLLGACHLAFPRPSACWQPVQLSQVTVETEAWPRHSHDHGGSPLHPGSSRRLVGNVVQGERTAGAALKPPLRLIFSGSPQPSSARVKGIPKNLSSISMRSHRDDARSVNQRSSRIAWLAAQLLLLGRKMYVPLPCEASDGASGSLHCRLSPFRKFKGRRPTPAEDRQQELSPTPLAAAVDPAVTTTPRATLSTEVPPHCVWQRILCPPGIQGRIFRFSSLGSQSSGLSWEAYSRPSGLLWLSYLGTRTSGQTANVPPMYSECNTKSGKLRSSSAGSRTSGGPSVPVQLTEG